MTHPELTAITPRLLRPADVARQIRFGQTKVRQLIARGLLEAVLVDGVIRIPADAVDRFVATLPAVVDRHEPEVES